tara:strand:- start:458 stop:700 length:243 start_codon:yes stop_codon:yes gene_type:complete
MTNDELLDLLAEALGNSAKVLADKAALGEISAAEITQLRALFKEAGGATMTSQGEKTPVGDSILEGMSGLDDETLKDLMN